MTSLSFRTLLAVVVVVAILAYGWSLSADPAARSLTFSLLTGAALGIVLQRSRFCFLCNFRDFVEARNPRGLFAIVVALGVGTLAYMAVTMAWVPVLQPGRLPPNAHIGPVGPVLAFAAFVFGIGMAISGSCLSAHFYRLGEGSPTSPFALVGAALGFYLGFLTWNPLFLASVSESPPLWLPHIVGYGGTVALTIAALALVSIALASVGRWTPGEALKPGLRPLGHAIFVQRWPGIVGGTLVGLISALYFLRVAPLGVTAELGSLVRTAGASTSLLPDTLLGLDTLRGCATIIKETLVSNNGLLVAGIIAGSFASALIAGQFRPSLPTAAQVAKGLTGGVLMGWGAMTALGCTVGVLLSGIHAGAVSGWVFLVACTLGVWAGLVVPKRLSGLAAQPER
jgi:uncharacterized membrane protein YedE/YeeE